MEQRSITPRAPSVLRSAWELHRQSAATPRLLQTEPEQIVVKEADFRRCGHDLKQLRERDVRRQSSLDLVEAEQKEREKVGMSFKLAFARQCRQLTELRDPWKGLKNPELSRPKCEGDMILNQVWVKASPKDAKHREGGEDASSAAEDPKVPMSARRGSKGSAASCCGGVAVPLGGVAGPPPRPGIRIGAQMTVRSRTRPLDEIESEAEVQERGAESELACSAAGSMIVRDAVKSQRSGLRVLEGQLHYDAAPRSAWIALDVETGEVQLYRRQAAERLEAASRNSRASVPLAGLGREVEDAIVIFDQSDAEQGKETSLCGREREVQRIAVPGTMMEINVSVAREGSRYRLIRDRGQQQQQQQQAPTPTPRSGGSTSTWSCSSFTPRSSSHVETRRIPLSAHQVVASAPRLPTLIDRNRPPMTFLNFGTELWG